MLWRYNKEAVALRIAFFTSARAGGEAHTVLVRDIPGLPYGTLAARIEDTVLRFLPRFIKRRIVARPLAWAQIPQWAHAGARLAACAMAAMEPSSRVPQHAALCAGMCIT